VPESQASQSCYAEEISILQKTGITPLFLAIHRHGSFRAAADGSFASTKSGGRDWRRWNGELGAKLFARPPTANLLTAAGEALLVSAQRMAEERCDRTSMRVWMRTAAPASLKPDVFRETLIVRITFSLA